MKKVRTGKFDFADKCWNSVSANAKDFIRKLLTYEQDKRPTAEMALQHPWIQELSHVALDASMALGALDNLKGFRADQTLKAATYAFIAS